MRALNILVGILLWLALGGQQAARAQAVPDAGSIRQQFEQDLKPALPVPSAPPLQRPAAAPLQLPDGMQLDVAAFRFAGNTLLSDGQLQAAVRDWLQRPVGFADLQQAAQAVAEAYRQAGWIVRTYLPRQDVTEGVVTIQVVEARFAGVRIDGAAPARVPADLLVAHVTAQQRPGQPLRADALDRALLLADDLPGVSVRGALEPGADDGDTVLVLSTGDEPLLQGDAAVDNQGARSTGAARAIVSARLDSALGRGDQIRADLALSRGNRYGRLGASLPVGADGLRLGVSGSALSYRLVGDDFSALDGRGRFASAGADLTWALLRSRQRNLSLALAYDEKRYRNRANDVQQSRYRVGSAGLLLTGNLFDDLGGGGANGAALSWSQGRLRQGTPDPGENPDLAGSYGKLRYSVSRQQALTPALSLYGVVSGQSATKTLDSSERFYLGGPGGVRAYPVNECGGSRGTLASLELRWRALPEVTASGFYDGGRVSGGVPGGRDLTLKGYGVSVAWNAPRSVDLKATLALRDGHNPSPTASGKDQDGSLKRARVWLQAGVAF